MESSQLKVALINCTKNDYIYLHPPLGILSIASYLLRKGIVSKKNIMVLDVSLRDPLEFIKHFQPDIIGLSAQTTSYPDAIKLGKRIKKNFNIPIVIGGIHISVLPNEFLWSLFDIGVIGEGEETFFELLRVFFKDKKKINFDHLKRVKGLIFRDKENKLIFTGVRPLISSLDKIPSIDWSLIPTRAYFRNEMVRVNGKWQLLKLTPFVISRGCPYHCVFCARNSIWSKITELGQFTFGMIILFLVRIE